MGLFSGFFGGSNKNVGEEKVFPWIPLNALDQLQEIDRKSTIKPQLIFKHSTTCGISRMVMRTFTNTIDITPERIDIYYLDLHAHREVSDEVSYKFQVLHQSPQVLIIKNGKVIAHASHGAITEMDFETLL